MAGFTVNTSESEKQTPSSDLMIFGGQARAMSSSVDCLNNTEVGKTSQKRQQAKDGSPSHRHDHPCQSSQKSNDAQKEKHDVARSHSVGIFIHKVTKIAPIPGRGGSLPILTVMANRIPFRIFLRATSPTPSDTAPAQ
jgi:hypothetical protein